MKRIIFLLLLQMLSVDVFAQNENPEVDKGWRWVTPLQTKKADIEKAFGNSITKEKDHTFQTYVTEFGKINVAYTEKREVVRECSCIVEAGTVLDYFISPAKRFKLSDLKKDLNEFKKDDAFSPREISYYNEKEGLLIATTIVKLENGISEEMVFALEYRPTVASCTNARCQVKKTK